MRRAAAPLLGLLAAAGLAGALAARLGPLPEGAEGRRAERLMRRAAEALEQDAARLAATSRRLARDPALLEIVEGGSGGVRPGRLFSLLGSALPKENGWGVVLLDRTGGAVAWAGEPGDLPAPSTPRAGSFSAMFHVTQWTLAHESPVGGSPETRGRLVLTRHFPTGIVRPDVLEGALPGRFPDGAPDTSPRFGRAGPPRRPLLGAGGAGRRRGGRTQGRCPALGAPRGTGGAGSRHRRALLCDGGRSRTASPPPGGSLRRDGAVRADPARRFRSPLHTRRSGAHRFRSAPAASFAPGVGPRDVGTARHRKPR